MKSFQKKKVNSRFFFLLFLFFLFFSVSTFSQSKKEKPLDYNKDPTAVEEDLDEQEGKIAEGWGSLNSTVGSEVDKAVSKDALTNHLFNELGKFSTSFDLAKGSMGKEGDEQASPVPGTSLTYGVGLRLQVYRKAIANKNVRSTYSVYDYFKLSIVPSVNLGFSPFYAKGNANIDLEFQNVRTVSPRDYKLFPRLKTLIKQIKRKSDKEPKRPSHNTIKETNEEFKHFMPPSDKEIFGKVYLAGILNPITQTLRLPLRTGLVKYMEPYEVMSYSLNGGVYLGVGFGTPLPPQSYFFKVFRSGIEGGFFVKGQHRVTVLREPPGPGNDQFVRIKLTRIKQRGVRGTLGNTATTDLKSMMKLDNKIEGNFIYKTLAGIPKFRPFTYSMEKSKALVYEQAYRVNINTKEGAEAYNKAAWGDFRLLAKYSSKKGFMSFGKLSKKPVERIYTKKEKKNIKNRTKYMELFLVSLRKSKVITTTETDGNVGGQHEHYFDTEVMSERQRKILFAFNNDRSHKFTVHIDPERFKHELHRKNKDPNSLYVVVEVKRSNAAITPKEYVEFVKEVESSLDMPGMFPLPPKGKRGYFKGNLGKTDLQYTLKINRMQVEKLLNYPVDKKWAALMKAFDQKDWDTKAKRVKAVLKRMAVYAGTIPMSMLGSKLKEKDDILVAMMKYQRWMELKKRARYPGNTDKSLKEFTEELGEFFYSGDYGPEMIKLLRVVLDGEKIPYQGYFNNKLINAHRTFKFRDTGKFVDPNIIKMKRSFDYYRPNWEGIQVSGLTASLIGKKFFTIRFSLKKKPKTLYFNLRRKETLNFFKNKSLETIVIKNDKGQFKEGLNIIQFRIEDRNHPLHSIVEHLVIKKRTLLWANRYRLTMAASENGMHYGDAEWTDFRTRILKGDKAVQEFKKFTNKNFEICLGKTAAELILFLGDRQFFVCPKDDERNEDSTCKRGLNPYKHSKNKSKKENTELRNEWIIKNCPKTSEAEKIKKLTEKRNVCRGMNGKSIITHLGKKPFYMCDLESKDRDARGFCRSGWRPYKASLEDHEDDPFRARNEWIMQYCPL